MIIDGPGFHLSTSLSSLNRHQHTTPLPLSTCYGSLIAGPRHCIPGQPDQGEIQRSGCRRRRRRLHQQQQSKDNYSTIEYNYDA